MELVLDPHGSPAPRLAEAHVARDVAGALYSDLRGQAVRMLQCDVIHGDLSPYNVLLGRHGAVVIDFPQVVGAAHNSQAESFFQRDLENLRRFFAAIDPSLHASSNDAREIWRAYVRRDLTADFVPSGKASRPLMQGPPTRVEPQRSRSHEGTAVRERAWSERSRHTPRTKPYGPTVGGRGRHDSAAPARHEPSGREPDRRRAAPVPEVIRVVRPALAAKGAHAAPPHSSHSATPPAVAGERADVGRSRNRRRRGRR
jgi:RIO kinase 1